MPQVPLFLNWLTNQAIPALTGSGIVSVVDQGADPTGANDSTTIVQNAINSTALTNGGVIFFPPGKYTLSGGINVTTGCRLVGSGQQNTILTSGGIDVTVVTLNAHGATLEHLLVQGKGAASDTFGASSPAIFTDVNWVDGLIFDVEALYGSAPIKIGGSDSLLLDFKGLNGYGLICQNDSPGGCWFVRCKFDQNWPTGTVPSGMANAVPVWAAATGYVANQIVSTGGFIIQCKTAGTSGGSAPTLKNYFVDIPDGAGTLVWRLVCPVKYTGMTISQAGSQHVLDICDFTGCFTNGLLVAGAVVNLMITHSFFGQHLSAGINTNAAGSSLTVSDCEIVGGIFTSIGSGLNIGATWSQSAIIRGNKFDGTFFGSKWGVIVNGGVLTVIEGNSFNGSAQAIEIVSGITDFVIANNVISSTASIKVDVGASDYYNIVNNIVHGVAISDGGAGAHKTVSGNN